MNREVTTTKKLITCIVIYSHFLVGCVANSPGTGAVKPGPGPSASSDSQQQYGKDVVPVSQTGPKLDVVIPVFDPGLSEKAENYEEEGVWPELRRAEANRLAYKMKQALDATGAFGAVRVSPDSETTGDLYVLGSILKSDGEDVRIKLEVTDISGKKWFNRTFSHSVTEGFYKNIRKQGEDPYDPLFEEAADEIVDDLKDQKPAELEQLKQIADLRFGASFSAETFNQYMDTSGRYYKVVALPSDNDPMVARVDAIRVREQLFVDNLQINYAAFNNEMEDSYLKWQEASFTEKKLRQEAQTKGLLKAIGGVLLIGLAVATANNSSGGSVAADTASTAATVAGGLGGAWMLSSSFQSFEEASFHKDSIDELGESVNMEMAPQVVSFEEETVQLTGNVQEQYQQWRDFLQQIFEQEATPMTEL